MKKLSKFKTECISKLHPVEYLDRNTIGIEFHARILMDKNYIGGLTDEDFKFFLEDYLKEIKNAMCAEIQFFYSEIEEIYARNISKKGVKSK